MENAQNPSVGGTGIDTSLNDLGDISVGPVKMFDGGRRTARNAGTIGADVTFTVYTP